jgi:biotin transport system substrate-specific component
MSKSKDAVFVPMQVRFSQWIFSQSKLTYGIKVFAASMVLALAARISVPFYPVPMYLFSTALLLISFFGGARFAFSAAALYLVEASIGLPVLSGGRSDILWLFSPVGGYIAAYPLAAWIMGSLTSRFGRSFSSGVVAGLAGNVVIFTFGLSYLSYLFGLETALKVGLVPFWLKDIVNTLICSFVFAGFRLKRK